MRPGISLADALRVAAVLGPLDADARDAVLEALGMTNGRVTAPPPSAIGVWQPSSTEVATRPAVQAMRIEPPISFPPRPDRSLARADKPRRTIVTKVREEQETATLPSWLLVRGDTLEPPTHALPPLPTARLFSPLQERAMLTAALSTRAFEGDLDIEEIADVLASGRLLGRVPRVATTTVRRGVQVLVDSSAALDPYRSDVQQILVSFDALLADDRLQIHTFFGCPGRGVLATQREAEPWPPPALGTLVAIISDFGIGGPMIDDDRASAAEWLGFLGLVRRGGYSAVGFVPYEARRWPPAIARSMRLIHWSERTTVGEIRRALRETSRR